MAALERFTEAQQNDYQTALAEIRSGSKRSHWMWYIFPQLTGLGSSANAQYFGIRDLAEATAYLAHPVLGERLKEITTTLLQLQSRDAHAIFGSPDDLKLRSCMTLFSLVPGAPALFDEVINAFFNGEKDERTIHLIGNTDSGIIRK